MEHKMTTRYGDFTIIEDDAMVIIVREDIGTRLPVPKTQFENFHKAIHMTKMRMINGHYGKEPFAYDRP